MSRPGRKRLAGALTTILLAATHAAAAPSLVVDPPTFDFGVLVGDVSAPFKFTLRNEGSAPLHVTGVEPSCSCTSVFLPDSTLGAGDAVPLTGFFSSRKMEGDVVKTVFLETDDPERPRVVLLLRAWVQRTLTYAPKSVRFSNAWTGRGAEETVLFRPGEGVRFVIEEVVAPEDRLSCEVVPGALPGDLVLRIVLLPPDSPGDFEDTVRVRTSVKGREEIVIPVAGHIRRARGETESK